MPSFFAFQQGAESRANDASDNSPLLGRFRAVPGDGRSRHRNSILGSLGGALYGSFRDIGDGIVDGDAEDEEDGVGRVRRWGRLLRDLYIDPKHHTVGKAMDKWWTRWGLLMVLPAALVSDFGLYL